MGLRGTAGATHPLLWGVAAFLLHYIPFVGATGGILAMTLVSFIHFDSAWYAPFAAFGVCLLCDDRGKPGDTAVSRALVDFEPYRHFADFSSLVLPLGCDRHAPRCSTSSDLQNILRPYLAIETGRLIPWSTVVAAINAKG